MAEVGEFGIGGGEALQPCGVGGGVFDVDESGVEELGDGFELADCEGGEVVARRAGWGRFAPVFHEGVDGGPGSGSPRWEGFVHFHGGFCREMLELADVGCGKIIGRVGGCRAALCPPGGGRGLEEQGGEKEDRQGPCAVPADEGCRLV